MGIEKVLYEHGPMHAILEQAIEVTSDEYLLVYTAHFLAGGILCGFGVHYVIMGLANSDTNTLQEIDRFRYEYAGKKRGYPFETPYGKFETEQEWREFHLALLLKKGG